MSTDRPSLDNAGVRCPPPLLFVGGLAAAALIDARVPLRLLPGRTTALFVAAALLVVLGLAWMVWGLLTFRRVKTGIIPHHPATMLVTEGPYRFGRNPMYLGMSGFYLGVAFWLNSWWALLFFPIVIALLLRLVVRREEAYLERTFGAAYGRYCERVPRWIGPPAPTGR